MLVSLLYRVLQSVAAAALASTLVCGLWIVLARQNYLQIAPLLVGAMFWYWIYKGCSARFARKRADDQAGLITNAPDG